MKFVPGMLDAGLFASSSSFFSIHNSDRIIVTMGNRMTPNNISIICEQLNMKTIYRTRSMQSATSWIILLKERSIECSSYFVRRVVVILFQKS